MKTSRYKHNETLSFKAVNALIHQHLPPLEYAVTRLAQRAQLHTNERIYVQVLFPDHLDTQRYPTYADGSVNIRVQYRCQRFERNTLADRDATCKEKITDVRYNLVRTLTFCLIHHIFTMNQTTLAHHLASCIDQLVQRIDKLDRS